VIASGTEDAGTCSFQWQEHRVFQCDSAAPTTYNPTETVLVTDASPACPGSSGSWTVLRTLTVAECGPQEESRSMDIVAVLMVGLMCVCACLGFIAGSQR